MGLNIKSFALGCSLLVGMTPFAQAQELITAGDTDAILNIAKGYGSAALETDSHNDPIIVGRINGTRYGVVFYGCNEGRDCKDIQFAAAWGGSQVSADAINAWNRDTKFGKASIDKDGDPKLLMSVNLRHGVSRKNLDDTFDWWEKVLGKFEKEVLQ